MQHKSIKIEVENYQSGSYIYSSEAVWQILLFKIHEVALLIIHLAAAKFNLVKKKFCNILYLYHKTSSHCYTSLCNNNQCVNRTSNSYFINAYVDKQNI